MTNLKSVGHFASYALLRMFGFFLTLLPFKAIHVLGKWLGWATYYLHRPFRKKALTNLAIAKTLNLSEKQRKVVAKEAFETLAITCLEFFCLKKAKPYLDTIVSEEGSQTRVLELMERGQGVIFLSGHQANWEIPFLFMTQRFKGTAIGRPIKNKWLYNWLLSVREMFGGKIVMPRQAIKMGLRALKKGEFLGIVGDQAFPNSSYSYPLFGTRAWTASTPALLAYKTGNPLVVGTVRREKGRYLMSGSEPLWPDQSQPIKEEVPRLMDKALSYLEKSIQEQPGQWLWQHDRWKQAGIDHVKRKYRFGFVCIILPPDPTPYLPHLEVFKKIYPRSFLSFFIPQGFEKSLSVADAEVHTYEKAEDLFVRDWRYQIIFDFYDFSKLRRHYRSLGAFKTLNLNQLKKISGETDNLEKVLIKSICKPCQKIVTF